MKYTSELLAPLVKQSNSVAEVLRALGLRQYGSIHTHIAKTIRKHGLDTSHFTGRASNAGAAHKGGPDKKTSEEILVQGRCKDRREPAYRLRRALLDAGRAYVCGGCSTPPLWQGQTLRLHVEHRNGDWSDNRIDNLMFLCPNCHSQTPTHSGSKGGTSVTSISEACRRRRALRKPKES